MDQDAVFSFLAQTFGGTSVEGDFVFPKDETGEMMSSRMLRTIPLQAVLEMRISVAGSVQSKAPVGIAQLVDRRTGKAVIALETSDAAALGATLDSHIGQAVLFAFYKMP